MDAQLLVVKAKRTPSQPMVVLAPAMFIELPANTWQNMVDYLKGLA
jgi:hypothetical protein